MSVRVDNRDVIDRMQDVVFTAEYELSHPDDPVNRCECGATLLTQADDSDAMVCAGCGMTPSYWSSPGASVRESGECEPDADGSLASGSPNFRVNWAAVCGLVVLTAFWLGRGL